jgi:2-polyprenyl-6-methoxyphenol hydroxylase-like FAD-dependent oxidoreductase
VVVGADGHHSFVARSVKPQRYNEKPALQVSYYAYVSGLPMDGRYEVYLRPGRGFAAWDTNDGLTVVIGGWPRSELAANRKDIEGNFLATLDLVPEFAARFAAAKRETRFVGMSVPNFLHKPFGPGWALVGDAGYTKDFITGLGISDAFRDAELLAHAVDAGLSGRARLARALAEYEQRRNELSAHGFQSTVDFARLQPPAPEMQQLFAALRGSPRERDRLFGTFAGTVPPDEYFAQDNLARILGALPAAA